VNEDRPPENEGPRHQQRGEAEALEELGRERVQERQQAAARLDELRQRAEAAETRAAELNAELSAGVLGQLRGLCRAVRSTLRDHWPGAGGR
jgi:hypothetical protein